MMLHRLEKSLCALYVAMTYPIIALGNVWMRRIEGMEPIVERHAYALLPDGYEPTVSDIHPAGMVEVHAMGPDGQWDELHDYPVRLLPQLPGITIKDGRGE